MPDEPDTKAANDTELAMLAQRTGPALHLRGCEDGRVALAVLLLRADTGEPPILTTPEGQSRAERIFSRFGVAAWQYAFELPAEPETWYEIEGERYSLSLNYESDLNIAFVSCNGQEHGDRERPAEERNVMWRHLADRHKAAPINLILHGGDQIYADEILDAHPVTREWGEPNGDPRSDAGDLVAEIQEALSRALFQRYLELYGQDGPKQMLARAPSLCMWDDHDICDGWGSLSKEKLDSPVGQTVFRVAREYFLLFQMAASETALPRPLLDRTGTSLSWHVELPGLHLIAPDLRSERRRGRVMGDNGWAALETAFSKIENGRVLLISSVPALGPRLSIVEGLMRLTRSMEKYEDDLRDQWQSRTHREEWRRFLRALVDIHEKPETAVTVVSGEIHLATRGTLTCANHPLHQLVASGITHPPPPKAYAMTLGALARFGEAPLENHPIRLHPLPGHGGIYTAERNYLMLNRGDGRWRAWWELEDSGPTPRLDLS